MQWQYEYLDALEAAAEAGDAESQVALVKYHGKNCSYAYKEQGKFEIWGADHWEAEMMNLQKAVSARHPHAQQIYGGYLMNGHPEFGRSPLQGAKIWISGWLGSKSHRAEGLRERLLALAKPDRREAIFPPSGRAKLAYRSGNQNETATCGVRIHYKGPEECQIVIEQLPNQSLPSVTNASERIATQILYRILLAGIDVIPEKIQWYEAYPAGQESLHPKGSLLSVSYEWDGNGFTKANWNGMPRNSIAIDLSDIHKNLQV